MLFSYSRIKESDQITPVPIDSENTNVVVMCAYEASINNEELAITHKHQCKEHLLKRNV